MAWLQTYVSGTLQNWANRLELVVDHTKIDENLTDFPVLVNLNSAAGANSVDVSYVLDHLRNIGTVFEEHFSNSLAWQDIVGTTDYSSGYLHQTTDGQRARTISEIDYGSDWEVTFKFRHFGQGSYEDYFHVRPMYSVSESKIYLGFLLYTNSTSNDYLQVIVNGASIGNITAYDWYNIAGTWCYFKAKKEGLSLYVKIWPETDSEPDWHLSTTVASNFATTAYFEVYGQHVAVEGADVDDIVVMAYHDDTYKIAFTDYSGDTETYAEIDYWNYSNTAAALWVKLPSISSSVDTTFYLYYDRRVEDNTNYIGFTGSSAGQQAWDNYYLSVYHMAQDPSSMTLLSSKSASADFVGSFVSMSSSNLVDGPLGKELTFDGSADYIDIPWTKRLGIQTLELTVEAFVNGGSGPLLSTQRTSSNAGDGNFVIQSDNVLYTVYAWQSTAPWNVYFRFYPDGFSTGELNYIGYAIGDHNIDMCVNSQTNSQTFDWSWSGSVVEYTDVRMFMHQNYTYNTNYFNGNCSEFRISSVPRSKAWMTATNYAVRDSLVTFPAAVYKATGVVTENTLPVVRTLRLYREVDGMLVAETTSNTEGYYELETPYTDAHYVVCMDSSGGANYNHLIKKDVELEPV